MIVLLCRALCLKYPPFLWRQTNFSSSVHPAQVNRVMRDVSDVSWTSRSSHHSLRSIKSRPEFQNRSCHRPQRSLFLRQLLLKPTSADKLQLIASGIGAAALRPWMAGAFDVGPISTSVHQSNYTSRKKRRTVGGRRWMAEGRMAAAAAAAFDKRANFRGTTA